jgi:hypothetical protein
MTKSIFEIFRDRIIPPATPALPQIMGIGVIPAKSGEESHSRPFIIGDLVIIQTNYWKRIHFCNINCGAPCKVTWGYKRGISNAKTNEISSKISADLKGIGLPGISSEIGSKTGNTITVSSEEQGSREFIRTAPINGGVTHAHWQLMERFTVFWEVKKLWWLKSKMEKRVVEGETDIFDESHKFYERSDCPTSRDRESWFEKIKRGLQPLVAQGEKSGLLVAGKPNADGSYSLEGLPGKYKLQDRIPNSLLTRYLRFSGPLPEMLSMPLYLQDYTAPLDSLMGEGTNIEEAKDERHAPRHDKRWLALSIVAGIGILGAFLSLRSRSERRCYQDYRRAV